jgi:putative ABC transport system substrate-binding protein
MRRREFLGVLGGAAAAWPVSPRAQQSGEMRRIGVLLTVAESDPEAQTRIKSFQEGLREFGWIEGRNIRIDYRFVAGLPDQLQTHVAELVASRPEAILVNSTPATTALHRATRTIPIVFAQMIDPVAAGVVESLAKPGGNITGFMDFEFAMAGKWLEALREVAPKLSNASVLWTPSITYTALLREAEQTAPRLGIRLTSYNVNTAAEFEAAIAEIARNENSGLVVFPTPINAAHRDLIIASAIRHRLPTISPFRFFAVSGALMSYGVYLPELYRRSAGYVDRILRGGRPADLPVQGPTKFELVINLRTAKALGLDVPLFLQQRANEVIE